MKSVCVAESVPSMFEGSQMRARCDGEILRRLEWPEYEQEVGEWEELKE